MARGSISGWAEQGGNTVSVGGFVSTTEVQESFPSSTVTVFNAGTTSITTIYSDSAGTAKANPFTAGTDASYSFWTDQALVDIKFSGTGITTPFTISNISNSGAGGTTALPFIVATNAPYNAKGDNSTDNLTAMNAIVTALVAAGGGTVLFPEGTFNFSDNWAITGTGITVAGMGWKSTGAGTQLNFTKGSGTAITITGSNVILKDFELTQSGGAAIGISNQSSQIVEDHLLIYPSAGAFTTAGIQENTGGINILNTVKNCYIGGNAIGWDVSQGNKMTSFNNYFAFNTTNVRVGNTAAVNGFQFTDSTAEIKSTQGVNAINIDIVAGRAFSVTGSYFETAWDGLAAAGQVSVNLRTATGGVIIGNYMTGNSQSNYAIGMTAAAKNAVIEGNVFSNQIGGGINLNGSGHTAGRNYLVGITPAVMSTTPELYAQMEFNNQPAINVRGISSGATASVNLRGTATFASAGTKAVAFGTNETDNSYFVAISGSASETFFVTSKSTSGFTLNSSNAASTAVVDWILIR